MGCRCTYCEMKTTNARRRRVQNRTASDELRDWAVHHATALASTIDDRADAALAAQLQDGHGKSGRRLGRNRVAVQD